LNIREMLIDWFTESRYSRFVEGQLIQQRQDFTLRLEEKDARIKELKTELAGTRLECERMRLVLLPLGSPSGAAYAASISGANQHRPPMVPEFDGIDDWQAELNKAIREEANGISGEGRKEVYQQTADDGA
jgi:hypothetical protein